MRKKPRPPEPPALADGWYWYRNFIPLRGGGYNHEWRIARVEAGRVQPIGMKPLDPGCRYLQHALWHRLEPPPQDAPSRTALALEQAGSRQNRKNRRAASSAAEPTTVPH